MLADNVQRIAAIPGVAAASPQLFLHSLATYLLHARTVGQRLPLLLVDEPTSNLDERSAIEAKGGHRHGGSRRG